MAQKRVKRLIAGITADAQWLTNTPLVGALCVSFCQTAAEFILLGWLLSPLLGFHIKAILEVEVFSKVIEELKVRLRRVTIKEEARYGSGIS
jgi:hypothetical protein